MDLRRVSAAQPLSLEICTSVHFHASDYDQRGTRVAGTAARTARNEQSTADIVRYWKSASSFRAAAIEELDRLEAQARESIASGKAGTVWTLGGPTGAHPPMPVGGGGEISEKVRREVLGEAIAAIAYRRQLVEKHYAEMHHAATAAFPPLVEVVLGDPADHRGGAAVRRGVAGGE